MAPIDKSLIDQRILSDEEKNGLTIIIKSIFNLKNFMSKLEILELKKSCSPI